MKKFREGVMRTPQSVRTRPFGLFAVFLCIAAVVQNVQGQCVNTQIPVNTAPAVTGTAGAVGTTYRRNNIIAGVDMVIRIDSLVNGAGVRFEDVANGQANAQYSTSNGQPATYSGYNAAWQPVITTKGVAAGTEGRIVWKVFFYVAGTNTPYRFNCMSLLAVDIDGDNDVTREFVQTTNPYSFAGTAGGTQLTYSAVTGRVRATGALTTFQSIDSTQKSAMALFRFKNVDSIRYTTGFIKASTANAGDTLDRQNCLFFGFNTTFPNAFSRYFDTDGDGITDINDPTDLDDDNDGIADVAEYPSNFPDPLLDADSDGLANYEDASPGFTVTGITTFWVDANKDGVNDRYDMDLDGLINSLDLDTDGDGIPDLVEAGGIDTDGNGTVDFTGTFASNDSDSDGLINTYDASTGGLSLAGVDTDGDTVPNFRDLDSDNDGIPDVLEAGGADTNNDGILDNSSDIDGDGLADAVDGDVGNDGTAENTANVLIITSAVGSTPGKPASYPRANLDKNGLPNPYDLDSDDDGILDSRESGIAAGTGTSYDTNNDGVINSSDTNYADANGDGWADAIDALSSFTLRNTDGIGNANYLDIDSDDDGIPDVIEAQATASYIAPAGADSDADGIDNAYDNNDAAFGGAANNGLSVVDTEGDGISDYRDLDSDGDGKSDRLEGWDTNGNNVIDGSEKAYVGTTDTDGDGLLDEYDTVVSTSATLITNPTNNTTPTSYPDVNTPGGDRDWRQVVPCTGNRLVNPSFELPLQTTLGNHVLAADANITGWRLKTGVRGNIVRVDGTAYVGGPDNASDGNQYLDIADAGGTASQIFEITCASTFTFSGSFSYRNRPPSTADYNWTAKIEILKITGEVVATSTTRDFTVADRDTVGINAVWYSLSGNTGVLPAGRYIFRASMGNAGNFDNAYLCVTSCFKSFNTDGDLYINTDDIDSDNDGIINTVECGGFDPYADADDDGIPNYTDPTPGTGLPAFVDANSDGINDAYDADKDGIINSEDLDSDNDGIPDLVEAGGVDTDGNGTVDYSGTWASVDTDGDGLIDRYDVSVTGGVAIANLDTDGDGVKNYLDLDSDNDGIPDVVEVGGIDTDGNGVLDNLIDTDGDGLSDVADGLVGTTANAAKAFILTGTYKSTTDPSPTADYPQGVGNTDGRGLPNPYDLDSDDDGIADVTEAGGTDANYDGKIDYTGTFAANDTDGDGFIDAVDGSVTGSAPILKTGTDTNSDGRADSWLVADNADGSGLPNPYDLDSDDDGIPDLIEVGGVSNFGGGRITTLTDANNNGWLDMYDPSAATPGINLRTLDANGSATAGGLVFDFDGDGIANYLDLDSDNDGIPDILEQGGVDADNNGKIDYTGTYAANDADNDGFIDVYDPINNGTSVALGTPIITTSTTLGSNNLPASYSAGDNFDGTSLINMLDLDADGDGLIDTREAGLGITTDSNNDGVVNASDANYADANGDGWADAVDNLATLTLRNTDGRSNPNYLDIDSDDDGIVDNIEGQTTAAYIAPANADTDFDGIDNAYDPVTTLGTTNNGFATLSDVDGDGISDYRDLDSDNDGYPDATEGWDTDGDNRPNKTSAIVDADGDGLLDGYDNNTSAINPTNGTTPASYPNLDNAGTTELDWRELSNTDGDGIASNLVDIDDDNDGITDVVECGGYSPSADADGDGIPNYMDSDLGTLNSYGLVSFMDTDGDGIINSLDLDSDNDGIADIVEAGGIDSNGDGVVDTFVDANNNGLADVYDPAATIPGTSIANLDTDGDGIPNFRDLDSDNDGIPDLIEAGGAAYDTNKDGIIDSGSAADTDGDGFADVVDGVVKTSTSTTRALIITSVGGTNGKPTSYDRANADANGLPNPYDLDSDDDGITDIVEAGGIDANGDGRVDYSRTFADNDTDGDGLINTYDVDATGGVAIANLNTDGDAIPNYLDLDSDNDGIPDIVEAGGADINNNGRVDNTTDTDNDGLADIVDGIVGSDVNSARALIVTSADGTNGVPASYPRANMDGMGLPNPYDLDSDGDGIIDTRESGLLKDLNNDGVLNTTDAATYVDANGDGWVDIIAAIGSTTLSLTNTDGRGGANYLDIDADDDGITDNVEGQPTLTYKLPTGVDADNDGIDDAYDTNTSVFGGNGSSTGITPVNTDAGFTNSDLTPDYLDADSDGDGASDLEEAMGNIGYTLPNTTDTDGDGLLNPFDIFNMVSATANWQNNVTMVTMGANGSLSGPTNAGSSAPLYKSSIAANAERAYRNAAIILPVKLISFIGGYSNKVSTVSWTTANEDGHERYILERSVDGVTFSTITTSTAKGTANSSYTYADNAVPAVSVVYYRLQIVNADGSVSYSKVVAIRIGADKLNLSIYPNPVVDQVSISFASTTAQKVNVKVFNMQGAQVMARVYKAQAGANTLQMGNWNRLPAGDYLIEVSNDTFKLTQKLTHVH